MQAVSWLVGEGEREKVCAEHGEFIQHQIHETLHLAFMLQKDSKPMCDGHDSK